MPEAPEFVNRIGRAAKETRVGRRILDAWPSSSSERHKAESSPEADASTNAEPVRPAIDLRQVSDVMSSPPEAIRAKTLVRKAAKIMQEEDIGDVLVLNTSEDLVGIVTDRDITVRFVAEDLDPTKATVEEIMSPIAVSVPPSATVAEAMDLMREHEIRRLPVIAGGKAVGVVTLGDLSRSSEAGVTLADISESPANN
jgi:CBS domain-containing protein